MRCRDRFCREADGCSFRTKRWGAGERRFCSGRKDAGAKRTLPRRGRNDENRNFRERGTRRVGLTASPAQRVAVGEEEQGSGRMTSFCAAGKKTSEQSGLCSDVVQERRLELPRRLPHAPQTCLSTDSNTLAFPLRRSYYSGRKRICQPLFPVFGLGRIGKSGPGPWWRRTICS